VKGPIFANVLLADEIHIGLTETQAALLEAMQEHQVTARGNAIQNCQQPFFVLRRKIQLKWKGPIHSPNAQPGPFMFNVVIDYLPEDDEVAVVARTTVIGVRGNRCFVHRDDVDTDSCLVRRFPSRKTSCDTQFDWLRHPP